MNSMLLCGVTVAAELEFMKKLMAIRIRDLEVKSAISLSIFFSKRGVVIDDEKRDGGFPIYNAKNVV